MKILSFGEILWDIFETGAKIGGASLNFSAHLAKLGAESYILSALCNDELGVKSIEQIEKFHINKSFVTINSEYPTGFCKVSINDLNQPSYSLAYDTAYDNIKIAQADIDKINIAHFDAFYFGTLSQRNMVSRESLNKILMGCSFPEIFCDINIRKPFYDKESVLSCLEYSTILKISREEYKTLAELGLSWISENTYPNIMDFYNAFCSDLARRYNINFVIMTLDKDGALVYSREEDTIHISEKPVNKPVSTVGAGDSFSACFLYNYLNGENLDDCIDRAVKLSDYVVTHYEGVPDYTDSIISVIK